MNRELERLDSALDRLVQEYHAARSNGNDKRAESIHKQIEKLRDKRGTLAKRLRNNR
jgi:argininosuccinate lyase